MANSALASDAVMASLSSGIAAALRPLAVVPRPAAPARPPSPEAAPVAMELVESMPTPTPTPTLTPTSTPPSAPTQAGTAAAPTPAAHRAAYSWALSRSMRDDQIAALLAVKTAAQTGVPPATAKLIAGLSEAQCALLQSILSGDRVPPVDVPRAVEAVAKLTDVARLQMAATVMVPSTRLPWRAVEDIANMRDAQVAAYYAMME